MVPSPGFICTNAALSPACRGLVLLLPRPSQRLTCPLHLLQLRLQRVQLRFRNAPTCASIAPAGSPHGMGYVGARADECNRNR